LSTVVFTSNCYTPRYKHSICIHKTHSVYYNLYYIFIGKRGSGGSGGSIFINCARFKGFGTISVDGGNSAGAQAKCHGGGGGAGRIAIHHETGKQLFSGKITAYGGLSESECGGAGTILYKDKTASTNTLVVDNNNRCWPMNARIDFSKLDDINRGKDSAKTYIFDVDASTHDHVFEEIILSGRANLALFRRNIDTFKQTILVKKTSGDKSGIMHVGNLQVWQSIMSSCSTKR
jgi:hypothetical protein